jgi:hypothetical protein
LRDRVIKVDHFPQDFSVEGATAPTPAARGLSPEGTGALIKEAST